MGTEGVVLDAGLGGDAGILEFVAGTDCVCDAAIVV
jgi:hypothetical protein